VSLPPDLLQRPPEEACRLIVLSMLEEASRAGADLDDPDNGEALHDFRVALRRTRSALRTWRSELGKSAGKKQRRALAEIQRATGGGRDAQVALEWLSAERPALHPAHRLGHDWWVERLEQRQHQALAHARSGVREGFEAVRAALVPRLEVVTVRKHLGRPEARETFAAVLAQRARAAAAEVIGCLSGIEGIDDARRCHQARVAGKRLRYLVEPVREHARRAVDVVNRCKKLQDLLGDLNDAHVQRDELGQALELAAAERARHLHELTRGANDESLRREARRSERSGLLELTRRAQARMEALFRTLEEEWLQGGMVALLEDVEELAAQLEAAAKPPVEIERKFLLHAPVDFSPVAARVETVEIRQGWLPGELLHERVRRTVGPSGTCFERTIKLGAGVERIQLEESTTAQVFEALWPLTEGCRIHKRRHRVPDGELVWEIDEFLDRPLWLAEVELASADQAVEPPAWLAPYVERDVTDDPRYLNLKLAR
jgi:CHAD domain-containing protein